ncbi:nucleosome assembly protein 1;2 [Lactuca sativa]|uniref:Uncharacterized protein n=1 Tax=Lactuca sativa TaxID=4236 RepID=A0A9R1X4G4_LACSA|nr:nucleosome assembly protein 1;2 [Lactuca sativa]KAJ0197539.1 hypothetical protein LSAT_V11C700378430 [Lactuca sativa]
MASKSMVMASSLTGEVFEAIDVYVSDSDSDSWEVVEPSDSDDGNFSYGDVTSDDDEVVADVDDLLQQAYGSPSPDISLQSLVEEITHHCEEVKDAYEIDDLRHVIVEDDGRIDGAYDPYEEDADESEEEIDDDDDHDDLDDELVPKYLNNKFERQRMRKLGKRAYPKMKKSKRVANQFNKPGCVRGKHGLGLKHNLIR